MATVKVRGQTLDIDIRGELEAFEWGRARWGETKLVATSPFRDDRSPSFFVQLEEVGQYSAGVWADSGATDDYYSKGGFVKLLAYLRGESHELTEAYLLDKYGIPDEGSIVIKPTTLYVRNNQRINPREYARMNASPSEYMSNRGITQEVQALMGIRWDADKVAFPWYHANGSLATIKYRMLDKKRFWYEQHGVPTERLLYGINNVWQRRAKVVALCEGEVDAHSWECAGVSAVALGGSAFTRYKRDLIVASPIETLLLATDNDGVGERLREHIKNALPRTLKIIDVRSSTYKDSNEVLMNEGVGGLLQLVRNELN